MGKLSTFLADFLNKFKERLHLGKATAQWPPLYARDQQIKIYNVKIIIVELRAVWH